ncbi:restriction endonuclease subunit S [Adhaeribacter arboris]|uniref:Restriction endonuclease subunit S n=1 Tax=Adhaeribacter arboris TaxID=2072846 RepID=A0A2T2YNC9_9BACT|nr:restriction endonuclease subunit S [Adhaeribacter arboris]PSR56989.1 restriction endonuclease subunit S [Adhaeribacter arboris]
MTNWQPYTFSDFVEINPTISLKGKGTFSFIEMKDLYDGQRYVYPAQERTITGGARFGEGDTLFARITPCLENGKICQAKGLKNGVGFGSTEFLVFRERENVSDTNFIYYLSRWEEVRRYAELHLVGTSGRQRVPKDIFDKLELTLPDLETQKKIAEILSALDYKIELNRRMNQTLEQMAQTLFQQYFVNNIDNLSDGWRFGKIGEILEVKGGTTPSTKQREFWDGEFHWTSPKDLSGLRFPVLLDTEKKLTPQGLKKVSSGLLPIGTLLLSSRAPIGYLAITQIAVAINQGYIAILCNKGYSNLFMLNWLKENMNIIIQNANGSTFLEISKSVFKNIDLKIPPVELVNKFDNLVRPLFEKIVLNEKENIKLTEIRDSLLPKLMSGEIDVMQTKAEELYEPVPS